MYHRHAGNGPDVAVALAAQNVLLRQQQPLSSGAVGVVAVDAVTAGGWVDHRIAGLFRIVMAGDAQLTSFGLQESVLA